MSRPPGAVRGELDQRYVVQPVQSAVGKAFIREHHYSHGCHNGPMTWGLWERDSNDLIGVIAFATPCSENVRRSVFGPSRVNAVTELHRLVILDRTPPNTESWMISRALRMLQARKPHLQGVLSFADSSEGHRGVIYRATNALFTGSSGRATFYLDADGRLRHPRQNGHNITAVQAQERGWRAVQREAKYRYLYLLGGPAQRRLLRRQILLPVLPYPDDKKTPPVRLGT